MKKKTTYVIGIIVLVAICFSSTINAQPKLYGTTFFGGANGNGTIFSMDTDGSNFTVEHNINVYQGTSPSGNLVKSSDGKIYGSTLFGGEHGQGVIYQYDESRNSYVVIHSLEFQRSSFTLGSDGKFYGLTQFSLTYPNGAIYSYDPSTNIYTIEHAFDNTNKSPTSSNLLEVEPGIFYGVLRTSSLDNVGESNGVIFEFKTSDKSYTIKEYLVNYGIIQPDHGLSLASNGKIYGISQGDTDSGSKLYEYDTATETLTVLYDFGTISTRADNKPVELKDEFLYGVRYGSTYGSEVYKIEIATGTYTAIGSTGSGTSYPSPLIKASNGKAYGSTRYRGSGNSGVLYELDLDTETIVDKSNTLGIQQFYGSLFELNPGELYGHAFSYDNYRNGVIYKYNITNNENNVVFSCGYAEGGYLPALTQIEDKLFGLAYRGGAGNRGNIFYYDPTLNEFYILFNFSIDTGYGPYGAPVYKDGFIYGTTAEGGEHNRGSLFKYEIASGMFTKLYDFTEEQGANFGSIMFASNGLLYGFTSAISGTEKEMIFSYDTSMDNFTILYEFADGEASKPRGFFVEHNGKLYGTSINGGVSSASNGKGTIFSYNTNTGTYETELDFNAITGIELCSGSLLMASNGNFYGLSETGGSNGTGTLFELNPVTKAHAVLYSFTSTSGNSPSEGTLIEINGKLFGQTYGGGSDGEGVIFSYDIVDNTYTLLQDLNETTGTFPLGHLTRFDTSSLSNTEFENDQSNRFHIYPNPTTDIINIENLSNSKTTHVQLVNALGQTVYQSRDVMSKINLKNFTKGLYILKVNTSEGEQSFKIIKE